MTASTPSHLIAQARQCDTAAIAQLLNRALKLAISICKK
jgi:hypothetical protein